MTSFDVRTKMAEIDIKPILEQINARHLEIFKEQIRQLQEFAWEEGHSAHKDPCSANPYLKENDSARTASIPSDGDEGALRIGVEPIGSHRQGVSEPEGPRQRPGD